MVKVNRLCWILLITILLPACLGEDDDITGSETQKYYFLESLKLVEQAGRELQDNRLTQKKITLAMETMDQGLKLAFQVEKNFLDSLDVRLGKNYQRYFVKGVETYRHGIEDGDKDDQQAGLKLLSLWAGFWSVEQAAINAILHPD